MVEVTAVELGTDHRTGTAALDMISKISQDREETHLVPLVGLPCLLCPCV